MTYRWTLRLTVLTLVLACLGATLRAGTITLGNGVQNPPPSVVSTGLNPQEYATADTAALVAVGNFSGILQSVLNAQSFTNGNNWTLNTNTLVLARNATFNITDYHLFLNVAGTAFGENIDFNLTGLPATPANATLHWLQYVNTSAQVNGYGFAINNQAGFWQVDNGQVTGGAAAGPATGPYYDSNADAGFSVPPAFHDAPQFYSGAGTYLHFTAIPTWDVFTAANGNNPATETIEVGDLALTWGFSIQAVPEPSSICLWSISAIFVWGFRKRIMKTTAAA